MALFKKKQPAQVFAIEPDGTLRANGNGKGMFRIQLPIGWEYKGGAITRTETSSRLFTARTQITNAQDSTISIRTGEAGTRPGEGLQVLLDSYSSQRDRLDYFNYAEVPDPMILADVTAGNIGSGLHAEGLHLELQMNAPDPSQRLQEVYDRFVPRANAMKTEITDPFMGRVLRVYDYEIKGVPWKMAVYVQLEAVKDVRGLGEFPSGAMLGGETAIESMAKAGKLPEGINSAKDMGFTNMPIPQRVEEIRRMQAMISGGTVWCYPEFADYIATGTIYWCVEEIVTFVAPSATFDNDFGTWFMPFVDSLRVHEDLEGLNLYVTEQETIKLHAVVPLSL